MAINRRTKKLDVSMVGHRASHWDVGVTDCVVQAILDLMAGVAPADIARSGGHVTRVWTDGESLYFQTQGPHPSCVYSVSGTEVVGLLYALNRGRAMLDGRAA